MSKTQKQNTFFKSFLTTSAIVAVGVLPMSFASATSYDTTGANAQLDDGTNLATISDWVGEADVNSEIKIAGAGHSILANQADASFGINVAKNAADPGVIVSENATITGVSGDGDAINVDFGAAKTLILSGTASDTIAINTYDKLGAIDFNGNDGVINVTATGVTFTGAIDDTDSANNGILTLTGADNVFTGTLGATNALKAVNVNKNTTFKGASADVTGDTTIADGATLTLDSTTAGQTYTGPIEGGAAGKGTLVFTGVNAQGVVGNVGNTNSLASITTGAGAASFSAVVKATNITTAAGAVTFEGDVTVTEGLLMNDAASVVNLDGLTFTGDITTKTDNKGTLNITDDSTITGDIGNSSDGLAAINITGDKILTMNGSVTSGTITTIQLGTQVGGTTELVIGGTDSSFIADIKPQTATEGEVTVNATGVTISKITNKLGELNLADGASATILSDSFFDATSGAGIVLGNGSSLTYRGNNISMTNGATVEGAGAGEGTLVITDGTTIDADSAAGVRFGAIGGTNALAKVVLGEVGLTDDMGSVALPLELGDAINATTLHLVSRDGTGTNEHTVNLKLDSKLNGVGHITADSSSRLIVTGANYEVLSNVGEDGAPVNVLFTDDAQRQFNTSTKALKKYYINATSNHGQGQIRIGTADSEIHGTIGSATADNNLEHLVFLEDGKFGGTSYTPVTIDLNKTMTVIDDNTVFHSTVNSAINDADGTVLVNATGVQFNGIVGGIKNLKLLKLAASKTATLNDNALFHTTGIELGGNSVLTVNSGKTLAFANNATIEGSVAGQGKLILNGQTITPGVGLNTKIAELEAHGTTTITGGLAATTLTLGSNNASVALGAGAASDVTGIALGSASLTGTKVSVAHNIAVGTGGVAAIGELNLADDKTVTVTNGDFLATKVTSATDTKGTIHIKSGVDRTVASDFGNVAVADERIALLHLENTAGADRVLSLTGCVSASELRLGTNNRAGTTLRIGNDTAKVVGSTNVTPVIVSAHVKTSHNATGIILVDGDAAIIGDVGVGGTEFSQIKFNDDHSRLFVSNGATATLDSQVNFDNKSAELTVFGDSNLTIGSNILTGGVSKGSIRASGTTTTSAIANAGTGAPFLGATPTAYASGKTITIAGEVGDANNSLALIDAGAGNITFTNDGNHVAVDILKAGTTSGTVTLTGDRTYRFKDLTAKSLTFGGSSTIHAASTFLGNTTTPQSATTSFDAAAGGVFTITFQDGVNMNLGNALAGTTNGNAHKLVFEGTHEVGSGLGTSASALGEIDVANHAANGTVTFRDSLHTATLKLSGANAKAILHKNVTGNVRAAAANNGTLTIAGEAAQSISEIGVKGANAVGLVEVNNGSNTVTVAGQFGAQNVQFQSNGTLKLDHANTDITNEVTVAGGDHGKLQLGSSITLNAHVGTTNNSRRLAELNIGANTLTVANNKNLNTTITGDSTGVTTFAGITASPNLDIGQAGSAISAVNFAAGAASVRDIHATNINVNTGTVTLRNARGTTNITTGSASVLDGGYINVKGKAGGGGTLTTHGNATIGGVGTSANALAALNLTHPRSSVVTLDSGVTDIHSAVITHTDGTVATPSSLTTNGAYTMTDAALNLTGAAGQLITKGNLTLSGDVIINANHTNGTATVDASDAATTLNTGALNSLTMNLTPDSGGFKNGAVIFDAKTGTDTTVLLSKLSVVSKHAFMTTSATRDNHQIKLGVTDNTESFISNNTNLPANVAATAKNLFADNPAVSTAIGTHEGGNTAAVASLTERYFDNEGTSLVSANTQAAQNVLTTHTSGRVARAHGAVTAKRVRANAGSDLGAGVAAGSATEKLGVWAEVSGGIGAQGSRKGVAGYRTNSASGMLGVDTMLNDNIVAGLALSHTSSNLKYKNNKTGDKVKATNWVFNGYGSYSLNNDYFVRGSLTAGSNKAHSKELRGASVAHGKYNVESYSVEGAFGKSFKTPGGGAFTPSVGLRGYYVSSINYDETGAGALNKSIKQKSKTSGMVLASAEYATEMKVGDMMISPEAHASIQCDLGSMKNSGQFKPVSGSKFYGFTAAKSSRFSGRIGLSVSSSMNNIEYGIGYDADISDRYVGHEGTLKMRLSF